MTAAWYFKTSSGETGPLTASQLKQLAARGRITSETLVRKGELGPWRRAKSVKGLDCQPAESGEQLPVEEAASGSETSTPAARSGEVPSRPVSGKRRAIVWTTVAAIAVGTGVAGTVWLSSRNAEVTDPQSPAKSESRIDASRNDRLDRTVKTTPADETVAGQRPGDVGKSLWNGAILPPLQAIIGKKSGSRTAVGAVYKHGSDGSKVRLAYDLQDRALESILDRAGSQSLAEAKSYVGMRSSTAFFKSIKNARPRSPFVATFYDRYGNHRGSIEHSPVADGHLKTEVFLTFTNSDRSTISLSLTDRSGEIASEIFRNGAKAVEASRTADKGSGSWRALFAFHEAMLLHDGPRPEYVRFASASHRTVGTIVYPHNGRAATVHVFFANADGSTITFSVTDAAGAVDKDLIAVGSKAVEAVRSKHPELTATAAETFQAAAREANLKVTMNVAFYGRSGALLTARVLKP